MDFLSVLLRLLVRAGKERRASRERERQGKKLRCVDCHPCAGGLPQPLFSGLVLRGGLRERRDFAMALQNEKWHGSPKRGASSACYGLVKAVILICTPFLHCLIMERRCQGLIGRINMEPCSESLEKIDDAMLMGVSAELTGQEEAKLQPFVM